MNHSETGRNKWLAGLMGLAMPGLGQIYNGELIKGISFFIILLVLYILGFRWTVLLPDRWLLLGAFCTMASAMAVYIFAAADAWSKASRSAVPFHPFAYNRWYFYVAVWLMGWVLVSGSVFRYVTENIAVAYVIPSGSMEPTVLRGDRVLADRTAYRRMPPHKGDVVTMIYPDDRSKKYMKRIAALPGEIVTGLDGTTQKVPHGYVYVLGDNRENSVDSRHFGFVPLTDIAAKVRQVYFSIGKEGIRWDRIGTVIR